MAKPYSTLRAQMTPDAQAQAEAKARALLADDTRTRAAMRAYAVWFRYTYPTAPTTPASSWQLLASYPEGRSIRAMWDAIAQAVLAAHHEPPDISV